jgi:hypothetical protein
VPDLKFRYPAHRLYGKRSSLTERGPPVDEKLAENIVEKIIEDLSERECLKCRWEHFDDDQKNEIRERCKEIILKIGST